MINLETTISNVQQFREREREAPCRRRKLKRNPVIGVENGVEKKKKKKEKYG